MKLNYKLLLKLFLYSLGMIIVPITFFILMANGYIPDIKIQKDICLYIFLLSFSSFGFFTADEQVQKFLTGE